MDRSQLKITPQTTETANRGRTCADWRGAYGKLADQVPALAARARPVLAGFAACVDKLVDLHALEPALAASPDPRAQAFLGEMRARAASRRGGETLIDWPEGPAFLDRFVPRSALSLGGTSVQAAWTLAAIGAPAIAALECRNPEQLAVLHPDMVFVEAGGKLVKTPALQPGGPERPAHYILEYFAGRHLDGRNLDRSTRIIVRFADEGIEHDTNFRAYARAHAATCGPAILSSPNAIPPQRFDAVLDELHAAASEWRASGVKVVHLELGDYARPGARDAAIACLAPTITSLGLNLHELDGFNLPGDDPPQRAMQLAKRLGVSRLAVHGDHWALAVVREAAERERQALMLGCLLASARAAAGRPVSNPAVAPQAEFHPLAWPVHQVLPGGWILVSVPSPFLRTPASTIGLGDSFTAGTMLAYAQPGDVNG